MELTTKFKQALEQIANFDMSHKAYAKHMRDTNTILEVSKCYEAINIAKEALDKYPESKKQLKLEF